MSMVVYKNIAPNVHLMHIGKQTVLRLWNGMPLTGTLYIAENSARLVPEKYSAGYVVILLSLIHLVWFVLSPVALSINVNIRVIMKSLIQTAEKKEIKMVNIFAKLWSAALTDSDRDVFVSDWALSSIWEDEESADIPEERIVYLGQIWDAAHMSVKDICNAAGFRQSTMADRYGIPQRTFSDWCRGIAKCPDYLRLMMCELLGLVQRNI